MQIGILGAGQVGGNLGQVWASCGHSIVFGVRDQDKTRLVVEQIDGDVRCDTPESAVDAGDVVVLAIPWNAVDELLPQLADRLDGKILIDATNRLGNPPEGNALSAGETIARLVPKASVIKAFNSIGAEQLLNPDFNGQTASMFYCGDDPNAKDTVATLIQHVGFEPVDCGPLGNASLLESLARLWIFLAYNGDAGRDIAFRLLRG